MFSWNGAEWQLVCADCPPGPRNGAAMAGNGEVVLLFGGVTSGAELLDDTWLFDGASWRQLVAGGDGPAPRFAAQLAWDGESFVLFSGLGVVDGGGDDDDDVEVIGIGADTWRWSLDDARWLRVCGEPDAPCGPAARALSPFATLASSDPWRRGALLIGGFDFPGDDSSLGDAWLWDGAGWIPLGSPWADRAYGFEDPPAEVPFVATGAGLPASCRMALTALVPETTAGGGTMLEHRTWNVGFDADHDGVPDDCPPAPSPTPAPTLTPGPSPTPAPTARPGPGARRALIPIQRGGPTLPSGRLR